MTTQNMLNVTLSGQNGTGAFVGSVSGFANAPVNTNITSMTGLSGALQQPTAIQDTTSQNLLSFTYAAAGTVTDYFTISNGATNGSSIRITSSNTNATTAILAKGTGGVFIGSAGTSTLPVIISSGANTFSFSMSLSGARTLTFPDQDRDLTQIPASTATANQILLSASSARPVWSTSTYPATNAINTLLYASSANVISALATANSAVLKTSSGGIPSLSTTLPAGITIPQPIIQGVTDGSSAAAGVVGEVISSQETTGTVSFTSGQTKNLTSISLTAGDWDVHGNIGFGGTALSKIWNGISLVSATHPDSSLVTFLTVSDPNCYAPVVSQVINVSSTTTVYLVGQVTGTGTLTGAGILWARRMR